MPFYPEDDEPAGYSPVGLPNGYVGTYEPPKEKPATWGEGWSAALELENEVVGAAKWFNQQDYGDFDRQHNPLDDIRGTEFEQFQDLFVSSRNARETQSLKDRIKTELKARKDLERSGTWGIVAPMLASILSPTTLLPGGAIYRSARGGSAALSAARSAASVGAWNVLGAGIQEAALQQQQVTRTTLESVLNLTAAGVLGGALGGAMSGASSRALARTASSLGDLNYEAAVARSVQERLDEMGVGRNASAGAAQANLPEIKLESAGGLEKLIPRLGPLSSPDLKLLNSSSPAAREIYAQMGDTILYTTRNRDGIPSSPRGASVETRIKTQGVAREARAVDAIHQEWMKHRFGGKVGFSKRIGANFSKAPEGKLSEKEFRVEVGKAMSRGDQHEIPEVAAAAKAFRRELIDPLANKAITLGLLNADVVGKMRPKGSMPLPTKPGPVRAAAEPVADPTQRQAIKSLLDEMLQYTGNKVSKAELDRMIDEVAADPELLGALSSTLRGGPPEFAISPTTGRLERIPDSFGRRSGGGRE